MKKLKTLMNIILGTILVIVSIRLYFIIIEQNGLYYPEKEIHTTPADKLKLDYEDVDIKTPDGKTLNGWFIPAKDATATVIYYHGNAGNISDRIHRVAFFYDMGFNLLIFDYRGYGKSEGWPSENGLYKDALAAYDYLAARRDVDKDKIIIYGKSLGGAVAIETATKRKAAALVIESAFASTERIGEDLYPYLPVKWLTLQKYDNLSKVKYISTPKLIVHGRNDDLIAFKHGEEIYDAAAPIKQFLPFDGKHNDEVYITSNAYRDELKKFLVENGVLE